MGSSSFRRAHLLGTVALVLACSVYEAPTSVSEGNAGSGGTASGGSDAEVSGSASGGISGTGATSAGSSSAGDVASISGSGGSAVVESGGVGSGVGGGGGEGGAAVEPDACPDDPDKLAPGDCGCGIPETATPALADCHSLQTKLIHRYDFEGTGTAVTDRIGTAHGLIARGATLSKLDGKGVVLLGGGNTGAYVDLPNGLVSSLSDATFEAWVTWGGGDPWQRIFDFGASTAAKPEDNPTTGKSYIYITPQSSTGVVLGGYSLAGNSAGQEIQVKGAAPLALALSQVALVANDTADKLALYVDGVKVGENAWTGQLSALNDVNVWLGRGQYDGDSELNAVFHDFRVYGAALSDAELATSFKGGPDPAFLAK